MALIIPGLMVENRDLIHSPVLLPVVIWPVTRSPGACVFVYTSLKG